MYSVYSALIGPTTDWILRKYLFTFYCTFFLNVDYDALHFHMGWLKINILKVISFWKGGREGVTQKDCSVHAFDNVDNS